MTIKIMKMIEIVMIKIKNVMKRDNKYECEYNDNNEDENKYIRDNNEDDDKMKKIIKIIIMMMKRNI